MRRIFISGSIINKVRTKVRIKIHIARKTTIMTSRKSQIANNEIKSYCGIVKIILNKIS